MIVGNIWNKNLIDLDKIARQDFVKIWLAVDGPERILSSASKKNADISSDGNFVHPCQTCQLLYEKKDWHKTIVEVAEKCSDDVYDRYLAALSIRKHMSAA